MKNSLLFTILSIFLFSIFTFAQDDPKKEENPTTPLPEITPVTYPIVFPPILLPETSDSWTINIHTEGGIMGIRYLSLALNSAGKYQCGEKGELRAIPTNSESFLEVDKAVKTFQTSFYSKSLSDRSLYCNDCLYSSLSLYLTAKTEKKDEDTQKDKTEKEDENQTKTEIPDVRDIYTKVLKTVDCNTESKPK